MTTTTTTRHRLPRTSHRRRRRPPRLSWNLTPCLVATAWLVLCTLPLSVRGQAPTIFPTFAPSLVNNNNNSTAAPSSSTRAPSAAPTEHPSGEPTVSSSPSTPPTHPPSALPTTSLQPSASPSAGPTGSPSGRPTAAPSASPSVPPSPRPSLSTQPSVTPSASPSETPTASAAPSGRPSVSPQPTVSAAPSRLPSGAPTASPAPSQRPTGRPSAPPSHLPSRRPSAPPSASPTILLAQPRIAMTLVGLATNLTGTTTTVGLNDDDNNSTSIPLVTAWESLTSDFVQSYWREIRQTPLEIVGIDTIFLSEERLPALPVVHLAENATSYDDHSNTTTLTPTRIRPLRVLYQQEIRYSIRRPEALEQLLIGYASLEEALFLRPFRSSDTVYTNALSDLTANEELILLASIDFDRGVVTGTPMVGPTSVPTQAPGRTPTRPTPSAREEKAERQIIVAVVVVVAICVCVAAGYLYYLVRKEDRQPIVGALPDDLEDQDYYIDTRQDAGIYAFPSDSSLPVNRSDEDMPLTGHSRPDNPRAPDPSRPAWDDPAIMAPPPMAVLDDVPGGSDFSAVNDEIDGMDEMGRPHPSFDSGEGDTGPGFDMTGFQLQVANLDDL